MSAKPPTIVDLVWTDRLQFSAKLPTSELMIDSAGEAGPSPVDMLGVALAGCMSVDVVYILRRGRHQLRALRSRLVADRAPDEPHRFVAVTLHFVVESAVPEDAIHRAIALSREKDRSVWHSLRQDIDFQVTFDLAS